METEPDRAVVYGGRQFYRFRVTVYGCDRNVWAINHRQAERMVAKYTGVDERFIEVERDPLILDLTPPSKRAQAEAA